MFLSLRFTAIASLLIIGAACSSSDRTARDTAAPGAMSAAASSDTTMTPRGGMAMSGMHADTVVARVQRDLAAMDAASGDAIVPLVPAHRQTVEALIADCEMMMKQTKMTPPTKWHAAVTALRKDLGTMATAKTASLHAMWPQHKQRVQAMLDMRHDMMKM